MLSYSRDLGIEYLGKHRTQTGIQSDVVFAQGLLFVTMESKEWIVNEVLTYFSQLVDIHIFKHQVLSEPRWEGSYFRPGSTHARGAGKTGFCHTAAKSTGIKISQLISAYQRKSKIYSGYEHVLKRGCFCFDYGRAVLQTAKRSI